MVPHGLSVRHYVENLWFETSRIQCALSHMPLPSFISDKGKTLWMWWIQEHHGLVISDRSVCQPLFYYCE